MGPFRRRWIPAYYLATPAFALLDGVFGANVRAVGLDGHPEWRAAWYAGCLACGVLSLARPGWAAVMGIAESTLNLLTLVLSVFLPYLALAEQVQSGALVTGHPFSPAFVFNLMLSSGVWLALWYGGAGLAWRRGRPALS